MLLETRDEIICFGGGCFLGMIVTFLVILYHLFIIEPIVVPKVYHYPSTCPICGYSAIAQPDSSQIINPSD